MSQIFDEGKLSLADRHVVVHPPCISRNLQGHH
jgi:hypothetical protein